MTFDPANSQQVEAARSRAIRRFWKFGGDSKLTVSDLQLIGAKDLNRMRSMTEKEYLEAYGRPRAHAAFKEKLDRKERILGGGSDYPHATKRYNQMQESLQQVKDQWAHVANRMVAYLDKDADPATLDTLVALQATMIPLATSFKHLQTILDRFATYFGHDVKQIRINVSDNPQKLLDEARRVHARLVEMEEDDARRIEAGGDEDGDGEAEPVSG